MVLLDFHTSLVPTDPIVVCPALKTLYSTQIMLLLNELVETITNELLIMPQTPK